MVLTMKALQEQINDLRNELAILKGENKSGITIKKNLGIGDTFELCNLVWKILDITDKGYVCLAERLEDSRRFDSDSNDWKSSDLREYLNGEFYEELAGSIGEENIIPFERDLLSLDGLKEYGNCEDKVSLISVDEYRKYREFIPNTDNYWWWTITPDSCRSNNDNSWVRVVSPRGGIGRSDVSNYCGVRPFCIFSASIFESEE